MPSLFCWGDRLTPHLVLDQTDDAVIIQVNGESKTIQQSKVKGWAKEGDRVRVLMGYNWCNGTVLGGDTLRVDLDKLGIVPIHKTGVMQPLYVPASEVVTALAINDLAPETITVKIITLWQPWASLVAYRLKHFETRHWPYKYRGKMVIHAAARKMQPEDKAIWEQAVSTARLDGNTESFPTVEALPLGSIVAIADLNGCLEMVFGHLGDNYIDIDSISALEEICGNWETGRYAWQLDNVQSLVPFPYKGAQGIKDLPIDIFNSLRVVS